MKIKIKFILFILYFIIGINKNKTNATICQQNEDTVIFLNIKLGKEAGESEEEKLLREKRIADSLQAIKSAGEKRIVDSMQMIKLIEDKKRMELELMQLKLMQEQLIKLKENDFKESKLKNQKDVSDSIAIIRDYIKENNILLTPTFIKPLSLPVNPDENKNYNLQFKIHDDARLLYDNYQIYAELADENGRFCDSLSKIKLFGIYKACKNLKMENLTTEITETCFVDDNVSFIQEIRPGNSFITMSFNIGLLGSIGFFDCHTNNPKFNEGNYWNDRSFKIKIRGVKILSNGAKIYGPYSAYNLSVPIKLNCDNIKK